MLDLERKIAEWRKRMTAGGIKTPAVLDELENHLREDVEQQVRSGANPAQAFEAATRRIGQSDLLKAEFAKVGELNELRPGRVIGIACGSFAVLFSLWVAPRLLNTLELSLPQRMMGFAAVALTLFSAASWRFSYKYLPVIRSRRARTMAGLLCGVGTLAWFSIFGSLLSSVIVPNTFRGGNVTGGVTRHYHQRTAGMGIRARNFADTTGFGAARRFYGESHGGSAEWRPVNGRVVLIGLSLLWAMTLVAIFGAIAYGLEEAARRRMGKDIYV